MTTTILHGDARLILPTIQTASHQIAVTSPPYYASRHYGTDAEHEIGWGTVDDYLGDLAVVLDELHRVLDPDATAWFVLGDKAAGSGGAGGDHLKGHSKNWIPTYGKAIDKTVAPGQWLMIPERFALMAQQRGWLVRSIITWDKMGTRPEDPKHANRPLVSTERIILLGKKVRHRWYPERCVERGDIWHVRPHRGAGAERHFAPFPAELPRRAILAASQRGDRVIDPFGGTHCTANVAHDLGRSATSIELYQKAAP